MVTINNENYLSVKETMAKLAVSKMTLWRWTKEGKIKILKLSPKKVYYKESEINNLFSQ